MDLNGEARLLASVAPRINTFIDVGANVGTWTNAVLLQRSSAQGILIEPTSDALSCLRANVPGHMIIVEAAAGRAPGQLKFYDEGGGSEHSSAVASSTSQATPISVPVVTIDMVLEEHGWDSVDLLKIDAEGYDAHVLAGAADTLERQAAQVIQFEYGPAWIGAGCTLSGVLDQLHRASYTTWVLRPGGPELYHHRWGEFFNYSNFVATTRRGTSWLARS
jgi:FkbM family methyltransferase